MGWGSCSRLKGFQSQRILRRPASAAFGWQAQRLCAWAWASNPQNTRSPCVSATIETQLTRPVTPPPQPPSPPDVIGVRLKRLHFVHGVVVVDAHKHIVRAADHPLLARHKLGGAHCKGRGGGGGARTRRRHRQAGPAALLAEAAPTPLHGAADCWMRLAAPSWVLWQHPAARQRCCQLPGGRQHRHRGRLRGTSGACGCWTIHLQPACSCHGQLLDRRGGAAGWRLHASPTSCCAPLRSPCCNAMPAAATADPSPCCCARWQLPRPAAPPCDPSLLSFSTAAPPSCTALRPVPALIFHGCTAQLRRPATRPCSHFPRLHRPAAPPCDRVPTASPPPSCACHQQPTSPPPGAPFCCPLRPALLPACCLPGSSVTSNDLTSVCRGGGGGGGRRRGGGRQACAAEPGGGADRGACRGRAPSTADRRLQQEASNWHPPSLHSSTHRRCRCRGLPAACVWGGGRGVQLGLPSAAGWGRGCGRSNRTRALSGAAPRP